LSSFAPVIFIKLYGHHPLATTTSSVEWLAIMLLQLKFSGTGLSPEDYYFTPSIIFS